MDKYPNEEVKVLEEIKELVEELDPSGGGLPDGGTTGQALVKKSDADQDVEWANVGGGSDVVIIDLSEGYIFSAIESMLSDPDTKVIGVKMPSGRIHLLYNLQSRTDPDLQMKTIIFSAITNVNDTIISYSTITIYEDSRPYRLTTSNTPKIVGADGITVSRNQAQWTIKPTYPLIENIKIKAKTLPNESGTVEIPTQVFGLTRSQFQLQSISNDGECHQVLTLQKTASDTTGLHYMAWDKDLQEVIFEGDATSKEYVDNADMEHYVVGQEQLIGDWTEDGTTYDLYRKVIFIPTLPATGSESYAHGISSFYRMRNIHGITQQLSSGKAGMPIPFPSPDAVNNISVLANSTSVQISVGKNRSNLCGYITLDYLKERS